MFKKVLMKFIVFGLLLNGCCFANDGNNQENNKKSETLSWKSWAEKYQDYISMAVLGGVIFASYLISKRNRRIAAENAEENQRQWQAYSDAEQEQIRRRERQRREREEYAEQLRNETERLRRESQERIDRSRREAEQRNREWRERLKKQREELDRKTREQKEKWDKIFNDDIKIEDLEDFLKEIIDEDKEEERRKRKDKEDKRRREQEENFRQRYRGFDFDEFFNRNNGNQSNSNSNNSRANTQSPAQMKEANELEAWKITILKYATAIELYNDKRRKENKSDVSINSSPFEMLDLDEATRDQNALKPSKKLALEFHPDKGGSNDLMGLINLARSTCTKIIDIRNEKKG